MANIDIDPFSEQGKTNKWPHTGKTIPYTHTIVIKAPSWETE